MPVIKCRRCEAVATAQFVAGQIETSYGASLRDRCHSLADRGSADFVSSVTECPFMDAALRKLALRTLRGKAGRKTTPPKSKKQRPARIGWKAPAVKLRSTILAVLKDP